MWYCRPRCPRLSTLTGRCTGVLYFQFSLWQIAGNWNVILSTPLPPFVYSDWTVYWCIIFPVFSLTDRRWLERDLVDPAAPVCLLWLDGVLVYYISSFLFDRSPVTGTWSCRPRCPRLSTLTGRCTGVLYFQFSLWQIAGNWNMILSTPLPPFVYSDWTVYWCIIFPVFSLTDRR